MSNIDHIYVSYERTGGFAGMKKSIEISSDTLSIDDKTQLIQLIKDSGFFELDSNNDPSQSSADQFNYKITVIQSDKEKTLEMNDATVSDNLRPLITFLNRKTREL